MGLQCETCSHCQRLLLLIVTLQIQLPTLHGKYWRGRKLSLSVSAIAFILIPWGFMGANGSQGKKRRMISDFRQ